MTGLRIGSVFSGYCGLEMGVQAVIGGTTAWVSDIDPGACRILAHRYPDVPNLGDITKVDWLAVEPVDVLCGGFPCQDVSHAGKRAGLRPDTRSGLWSQMAYAASILRPRYIVAENVRGLLSARADSDVEPCPWCVGGAADGEPDLRALGAVLGDLAELGYDTRWIGLRAADVGAPHGRSRVFIVATAGDSNGSDRQWGAAAGQPWQARPEARPTTDTERGRRGGRPGQLGSGRRAEPQDGSCAAANTDEPGREGCEPARRRNLSAWGVAPDAEGDGRYEGRAEPAGVVGGPDAAERSAAHPDATGERRWAARRNDGIRAEGLEPRSISWGPYEPAVRRWEAVLGRSAPAPTETAPKGGQRLSPRFVEWMQGLPAGWVTDVPGLNRNAQLKALGNGVVPQQAAAALRHLLAAEAVAA